MARYPITIELDTKGLARSATVVGLAESGESVKFMKVMDPAYKPGDESISFAHHDFEIVWSDKTDRQEVVQGIHRFYGGMGEGSSYEKWTDAMLASLYDLYQTHGHLKEGDVFEATYLGERVEFRCEGVHVILA
jgi:hypothetical protein